MVGKSINTHRGGDVEFGMFFHYAKSEYDNLLFAARRQFLVPFPVALGKIPRKEFFKHGIGWLESIIYLCCKSEFDRLPAFLAKKCTMTEIRRNSQIVIPSLHKEWDLIGSLIEEDKKQIKEYTNSYGISNEETNKIFDNFSNWMHYKPTIRKYRLCKKIG